MREGTARHEEEIAFLRWALPRLGLRWRGFRGVRGQVLKRIARRWRALGLDGLTGYRAYLEAHPDEWERLEPLCRVTISRFHRDREVFVAIAQDVLPALAAQARARGAASLRCLSVGCASGEEPYTLALVDHFVPAGLPLEIEAIDADPTTLERAKRAVYPRGTLRELPPEWVTSAFEPVDPDGRELRLEPALSARVRFGCLDVRREPLPSGPFDLVLCRNLVFTYLAEEEQRRLLDAIASRLVPGGALVIGGHEHLPEDPRFPEWRRSIHRRER